MRGVFRRCGCRDSQGRQYGVLPEDPSPAQLTRACPDMLRDDKSGKGHGRWSYRISAKFDPVTKKRRQINGPTFKTKSEAQKARNLAIVKVDTGTFITPSKETFAEYLPGWLERRRTTGDGLQPSTYSNYKRYVHRDLVPSGLGSMKLGDIRRYHINAFIQQLIEDGRGAVTVRRIVAVIQGSLKAATASDRIASNPATMLELPKVDHKEFEPWEAEQVGEFLDTAGEHRLGSIFEVAVFTGLRRGELLGLRWEDVDLERREVIVRRSRSTYGEGPTKTDSGRRRVALDDRAVGVLQAWEIVQHLEADSWGSDCVPSGYVFTYANGGPVKPQYVTRLFEKLRKKADLPAMTFHGLRHQQASLQLAAGTPLAVVSKRLGHSSIGITADIYSHLLRSTEHEAANNASALVRPRRAVAHTVHTQGGEKTKEAVPLRAETASDLLLNRSG